MSGWKSRAAEVMVYVLAVLAFVALIGGILLIRLAIAGGDWGCVFAQDPALCVAVRSR